MNTKAFLIGAVTAIITVIVCAYTIANAYFPQVVSGVASGTAPFVLNSYTEVDNLNAELLDAKNWTRVVSGVACKPIFVDSAKSTASYTTIYSCTNCRGYVSLVGIYHETGVGWGDTAYINVSIDGGSHVFNGYDRVNLVIGPAAEIHRARFNSNLNISVKRTGGSGNAHGRAVLCREDI